MSRYLAIHKSREQSDRYAAVNSEASSRRKPGRPANRSKPIGSRTTNLGVTILDDDSVSAKGNTSRHPSQVLKEVAIPLGGRSSISSSLSSVRAESSEYDTPGTSTVVTPAESLMKEGRSNKRPSRISSSNLTCHSEESFKGKRKRKRMVVDELLEADAILARELQEQEYGKDEQVAAKPTSVRNGLIEDSEESLLSDSRGEKSLEAGDSAVFDLSPPKRSNRGRRKVWLSHDPPTDVEGEQSQEESSIEEGIPETLKPRAKRVKTSYRSSLPSRAARQSAIGSIQTRNAGKVRDSEDSEMSDHSDDASLFESDSESDAFEAFEDTDEEAEDVVGAPNRHTTVVAASSSSSMPTAIPATGRRATGRRGAPPSQAINRTRSRRSWQRRIEDRVSFEIPPLLHPGLRNASGCKRAEKARESAS